MLYHFDRETQQLEGLDAISAESADVAEKDIEVALAREPNAVFRSSLVQGPPVLVLKKSVRGHAMADIIALDAENRLVLVECKRGWAHRDALAQLLDYASDYRTSPYERLAQDWKTGEGSGQPESLIERYRKFCDDNERAPEEIGKEHVLVVVAAGKDHSFDKIADYLKTRGVTVYFVPAKVYRRKTDGSLFLEVEPIDLDPGATQEASSSGRAWMINTGATHVQGALKLFIDRGVAAIFDYPDGPRTLDRGAQEGDPIYVYENGVGIVAKGTVKTGEVYQAAKDASVFPGTSGMNEWHLAVTWTPLTKPVSNAAVRIATKAALPVRNTFCRLWSSKVRAYLSTQTDEVQSPKPTS